MSSSSIDQHQRDGVAWDIIAEAIEAYNEWMMDDDYDATGCLRRIIGKMEERRSLYRNGASSSTPEDKTP